MVTQTHSLCCAGQYRKLELVNLTTLMIKGTLNNKAYVTSLVYKIQNSGSVGLYKNADVK